jgi:hypothetical protein
MVMKKDIKTTKTELVSVQSVEPVKQPRKPYTKRKVSDREKRLKMKYLPLKEDAKLGKSLNSSVALTVYKHYGIRLWNNVVADLQSRVVSAKSDEVNTDWIAEALKGILGSYDKKSSHHQLWAHVMFLKGVGLIKSKKNGNGLKGKVTYVIDRQSGDTTDNLNLGSPNIPFYEL